MRRTEMGIPGASVSETERIEGERDFSARWWARDAFTAHTLVLSPERIVFRASHAEEPKAYT